MASPRAAREKNAAPDHARASHALRHAARGKTEHPSLRAALQTQLPRAKEVRRGAPPQPARASRPTSTPRCPAPTPACAPPLTTTRRPPSTAARSKKKPPAAPTPGKREQIPPPPAPRGLCLAAPAGGGGEGRGRGRGNRGAGG
nr:atherin-like [Aegilops tauschii subsp. strangulata]